MIIKLIQWNICNREKIENILKVLKEINPDIATVQELTWKDEEERKELKNKISTIFKYNIFEKAQALSLGFNQGNGIFSQYPIIGIKSAYVQNPTNYVDCSTEGRIYVESKINIKNNYFDIGTVHLSYTKDYIETPERDKETQKLLTQIEPHKQKYILAGDFNANRKSKYIREIEKHLINYDLDENTWPSKKFKYNGFEPDLLSWKIDYVFSTKDIKMKNIEVIHTQCSDHLPILFEFEI